MKMNRENGSLGVQGENTLAGRTNVRESTLRLTLMAMLAAMAVVVGLWKFPILPTASYLEFDFADVLIHLCTLMFGTLPGLCVLLVVSLIQAFLLGGNGWVGLVMHFVASGAVVVIIGTVCAKKQTIGRLCAALAIGTLAQTLIMIPMNYIFTPILFGVDTQMVTAMLLPAIIPFNLIKAGINCICTGIIFKVLTPVISRLGKKS